MSDFKIDDDEVNTGISESDRRLTRIRQARVEHRKFIFDQKLMTFDEFEFEYQYPGELVLEDIAPYDTHKKHIFYNFGLERLRTVRLDHIIGDGHLHTKRDVHVEFMADGKYFVAFRQSDLCLSAYMIRNFKVIARQTCLFKNVTIGEFHTAACSSSIFICMRSSGTDEKSKSQEKTSIVVLNSKLEIVFKTSNMADSNWTRIWADESYLYALTEKEIYLFDHGLKSISNQCLQSTLSEGPPREFKVDKNRFLLIDNQKYARIGDLHSGAVLNKFCSNAWSLESIGDKVYIIEEFQNLSFNPLRLLAYDKNAKYDKTYYLSFDTTVHRVFFDKTTSMLKFYDSENLIIYEILKPFFA